MGGSAAGKRRARPQGKEAALTAARGPAWSGRPRYMSDSEYAETKAALEARVPAFPASEIHETLSVLDTMSLDARGEVLRDLLEAVDGEGASQSRGAV